MSDPIHTEADRLTIDVTHGMEFAETDEHYADLRKRIRACIAYQIMERERARALQNVPADPLANFYTVREYVALPGDVVMYQAYNESTGIGCPGRETCDLALQDAEAMNAAVKHAIADHSSLHDYGGMRDRSEAWSSVTKLLGELCPNWYTLANTGEKSALAAIRKLHAEANKPWWKRLFN